MKTSVCMLWALLILPYVSWGQLTGTSGPWQAYQGFGLPSSGWQTDCTPSSDWGAASGYRFVLPNQVASFTSDYTPSATDLNCVWGGTYVSDTIGNALLGFFRLCFNVGSQNACDQFFLTFNADEEAVAWVNGTQVAQTSTWTDNVTVDITPWLTCGENIVAVRARDVFFEGTPIFFIGQVSSTGVNAQLELESEVDCEKQRLALSATELPGATYTWTGPNGFSSTQQNPVIQPAGNAEDGTYTCTISWGTSCCTQSLTESISVDVPEDCCDTLDYNIGLTINQGCLDMEVTGFASVPNALTSPTVFYNFGDGPLWRTSTLGTPIAHTYTSAGTYDVCMYVQTQLDDESICSRTYCETITVSEECAGISAPEFRGIRDGIICTFGKYCLATDFVNQTLFAPTSVTWLWGDGTSTSGQSPDFDGWHAYNAPGLYTVQMVVTYDPPCAEPGAPSCSFKVTKRIQVGPIDEKSAQKRSTGEQRAEVEQVEVTLYPNPVASASNLFMDLPEGVEVGQVTLINGAGAIVWERSVRETGSFHVKLPDGLTEGVYFLKTDHPSIKTLPIMIGPQ